MTATAQGAQVSFAEYLALPGLSHSMIKDLLISPLRMWHNWIRPGREPEEPTAYMQFGTALHAAVLEPMDFYNRFAVKPVIEDYPSCLRTVEDIREFIRANHHDPKGTRKEILANQALTINKRVQIWDKIEAQFLAENHGKTILEKDDHARVMSCATALMAEPELKKITTEGQAEVAFQATDEETGVPVKGRLDWVTPTVTLDVKTFTVKHGKSVDQSVADAIYYEGYHRQAVFYHKLRKSDPDVVHVVAFVESEPPHETRIKQLYKSRNLYWQQGELEIRRAIETYRECQAHFGNDPWRYAQRVDPLQDEEIPALAWGRA